MFNFEKILIIFCLTDQPCILTESKLLQSCLNKFERLITTPIISTDYCKRINRSGLRIQNEAPL